MMPIGSLFGRRARDEAADALYAAAVRQARRPEFYVSLDVPDSLDGRFDLLALHVFLLLFRLGKEGAEARMLSQAVFDVMFADMDGNLRELGVSDLAVGSRVKTMAKALYGRIAAYEPGLADVSLLKDALRRNLYRGGGVSEAVLAAMTSYVRQESAGLLAHELTELSEGRVRFGAPVMP
jgi:cytochrome b pre-mRNA-processing protein 3